MEEKKATIKVSTFIILFLILVIIFMGAVCYIVYITSVDKKQTNQSQTNNSTSTQPTNSGTQIQTPSTIPTENINMNSNTNVSTNPTNSTPTNQSIQGKSSTKSNPLQVGEWGIASTLNSQYTDIPMKISNVIRGAQAAKQVKEFCDASQSQLVKYTYKEPNEGCEWVVAEFNADVTNLKSLSSTNNTKYFDTNYKIIGNNESEHVIYNNYEYYLISTMSISPRSTTENIGTSYFAFQMPIGCTDYLMVLGVDNYTQAFFAGR